MVYYMAYMSTRSWITLITLALLGAVIYFGRHELLKAWQLMGQVNLWVLAVMVPVQIASYYAVGAVSFSYLRKKGNLDHMSQLGMTRLSLELNFVNHILPSGGLAGFSYWAWILKHHGVSGARATMSQVVRFLLTFVGFAVMAIAAFVVLLLNGSMDRMIGIITIGLVIFLLGLMFGGQFLIKDRQRLERFSQWLAAVSNGFVRVVTFGRKRQSVQAVNLRNFFMEFHDDYEEIMQDRKILWGPFLWTLLANACDVALLFVAFWALGIVVDPAILVVAFGVSSVVSIVSVTPGGTGVYEATMVAVLAAGGVGQSQAIAGTLLARVTLLLGTIIFGYVFYQMSIVKYGKSTGQRPTR